MGYILEMKGIEKTFGGTIKALKGANLSLREGEIHALVGENAAGKTTLMNVLYGMVKADAGSIFVKGEKVNISHPSEAIKHGIGMVHQHVKLVPDFNALENIILGCESQYTNILRRVNFSKAYKDVEQLLNKLNISMDLYQRTDTMSIGLQSKVEIVKTLFKGAKILILDEPTTVLAPTEVDSFLAFLKNLRDNGTTIIYISHRLREIFEISDSITILRHGENVASLKTSDTTMKEVASLMIGRSIESITVENNSRGKFSDEEILTLDSVCAKGIHTSLKNISFTLRRGEILGIAGIEGNGQVELGDTLIGTLKNTGGTIKFNHENIENCPPKARREKGLRYIPENRMLKGLSSDMTITENAILGYEKENSLKQKERLMDWKKARQFTCNIVDSFKVEGMDKPEDKIRNLSGGNIQKLIVGREMISNPILVVLCQPTVGIDFRSQAYIHKKILELREQGTSFLLISSDLNELMALSDRILVLYRGEIVKEFNADDGFDEVQLGYYMTGVMGNEYN